jgi:hypothetical protein
MSNWKSKMFGDNRINFYGWIGSGCAVVGGSLWAVSKAINLGALQSPTCLLLGAIYFVAIGQFCLGLQNYCSRVAKNIEAEDAKKAELKKDQPTGVQR